MKRAYTGILFFLLLASLAKSQEAKKPNIIFILADDLGYGDLGCYGQQKIKTPHIDQLANSGMKLTQFYTNTLCAATRCSFMTGYDGAHAQIRDNYELGGFADNEERGQMPLTANTVTIAKQLQQSGYTTALMGKWGLGGPNTTGVPNKQGFDFFYGYLDQKQSHNFYPSHLWRNEKSEWLQEYFSPHQRFTGDSSSISSFDKYKGKIYSADTITSEAIKFIDQQKSATPFFLYLAYTLPHLSLQVPDAALEQYKDQFDDKPYWGQNGYLPHPKPKAAYAGMVSLLDEYVGRIVNTIRNKGISENTIIIFCSDNGATMPGVGGAATDFFASNGILRGYKGSLYEGGIREPFIISWPGTIKAGITSNHVSTIWDMFATFNELAGDKAKSKTNGISMVPLIKGKKPKQHQYLYWEVHGYGDGIQAVRWKNWKAIRKGVHKDKQAAVELYNLVSDIEEKTDLSIQYPKIVQKMKDFMNKRTPAILKEWNF